MRRESDAMTAGEALQLLGLASAADTDAVSRAFRAAVKSAHPDRGGDPEQLRRVIEAHRVLRSVAETRLTFPPAPVAPAQAPRAAALQISIMEALFGGQRRVELDDGRIVDVRLPAGLRAADAVRLANAEGEGADVLLRISIAAERSVSVHGHDVWMDVAVRPDSLGPGAALRVNTLRGLRTAALPNPLPDRATIRLDGEGLPARGRHPAGDLILRIRLDTGEPASRRLLRQFSARWAA